MSEAKFTKGPWTIESDDLERECYRSISGKGHGALADVVWQMEDDKNTGHRSPKCEANAHLIAAAPELYEALASIENDDGSIPASIWEMRNAALAKARGESCK